MSASFIPWVAHIEPGELCHAIHEADPNDAGRLVGEAFDVSDAYLMAAAPALYEALRSIVETRWDIGAADACLTAIRADARAALAQARGEQ